MEQGITEIFAYFTSTIDPELEQNPGDVQENGLPNGGNSAQSYLQNTLAKLGPRVMGIRLLLGEDHAYVIVVTAGTRKKFELKATPAELRSKAFEVLESLDSRASDPRPHLRNCMQWSWLPLKSELKTA